ncbi:MAG: SpoIID/LytB domain-containing protein [Cyanosarcina radialis HA8281-LM2]|jgi:peptidoglycan hydrolase-like amidase|nr:SpoIID/LytB domain-containing protein [Cyanosarcina radialis HA8281-LM2]
MGAIDKLKVMKSSKRTIYWTIPAVGLALFLPFVYARSRTSNLEESLPASELVATPIASSPVKISVPSPSRLPQLAGKLAIGSQADLVKVDRQPPTKIAKAKVKNQKSLKTKNKKSRSAAKAPPVYRVPAIEIRVAIAESVPTLAIASSTSARLADERGQSVGSLAPMQAVNFEIQDRNLWVGNKPFPTLLWVEPANDGAIYVGDRWYRGRLLLVVQENKLLAVNYVHIEQYLYSVVGSEMHPNAPLEALKAQAVAARSYALVHLSRPASKWYNLGATQRWQVYKGIKTEYRSSYEAVNLTAGQFLSDRGRVVESLYAATAEIVTRVHGGWGMSQSGAYQLATQGYNYQQILGAYYPGVQLSRL